MVNVSSRSHRLTQEQYFEESLGDIKPVQAVDSEPQPTSYYIYIFEKDNMPILIEV